MASTLTKAQVGAFEQGAFGQFAYKIKWVLSSALANNDDGVIIQQVTISYSIQDAQSNAVQISTYTNNSHSWDTHKKYWEAWYIRAGSLRPTYLNEVPSFDQTATAAMHDDNYSAGEIRNHINLAQGQQAPKGITKGWVRYQGIAKLYRVAALNQWNNNWQTLLTPYNAQQWTPAALLPYSANDPQFDASAMEGQQVQHDMVAYWDSTLTNPQNRLTKIEDQSYTDGQLNGKVNQIAIDALAAAQAYQRRQNRLIQRQTAHATAIATKQGKTRSGREPKPNKRYEPY
jgi:hypothetical protein